MNIDNSTTLYFIQQLKRMLKQQQLENRAI